MGRLQLIGHVVFHVDLCQVSFARDLHVVACPTTGTRAHFSFQNSTVMGHAGKAGIQRRNGTCGGNRRGRRTATCGACFWLNARRRADSSAGTKFTRALMYDLRACQRGTKCRFHKVLHSVVLSMDDAEVLISWVIRQGFTPSVSSNLRKYQSLSKFFYYFYYYTINNIKYFYWITSEKS